MEAKFHNKLFQTISFLRKKMEGKFHTKEPCFVKKINIVKQGEKEDPFSHFGVVGE